jgi:hypothetical protein
MQQNFIQSSKEIDKPFFARYWHSTQISDHSVLQNRTSLFVVLSNVSILMDIMLAAIIMPRLTETFYLSIFELETP